MRILPGNMAVSSIFPPHSWRAWAAVLLGALLVTFAQILLAGSDLALTTLVVYGIGLVLIVLLDRAATEREAGAAPVPAVAPTAPASLSTGSALWYLQQILVYCSLLLGEEVYFEMRGRPQNAHYGVVILTWALSLAVLIVAASVDAIPRWREWPGRVARAACAHRVDVLLAAGITLFTLLLRVINLDHHPYMFSGDEGALAQEGVAVLKGQMTNPFGTGWYAVPNAFAFLQAGSIQLFGHSVVATRIVSALMATLAVLFTYLFINRMFGRGTAIITAFFLAVFHYHLYFSRFGSIQVDDSLFIMASLYFLDRGLIERRRIDCVLAGLTVGISQYFYYAGRVIPLVAVAYLLFVLVRKDDRWTIRGRAASELLADARLAGWILLGAVLTFLPLFTYFLDHPVDYTSRASQVTIFGSGWLATQEHLTGHSALWIIARNFTNGILLPFHTYPFGFYRGNPPFIGTPMAILCAVGLTLATIQILKRRYFGPVIAYWITVVGVSLTTDQATQRFVITTPLLALFAALTLTALFRIEIEVLGLNKRDVGLGVAALVLAIGAWNLYTFFSDPQEALRYTDEHSLLATRLGYYVQSLGPGTTVYFFGAPQMTYGGFPSIAYLAPDAQGNDVFQPWTKADGPLRLHGRTVFVYAHWRARELALVRHWFPHGSLFLARSREFTNGGPLFYAWKVR